MPYVTSEAFEQAFGQDELADLLARGHDFTKTESGAASLIDGYLASRYTLPLAAVPEMLRAWALDIARFRLWDDQAPEEVRRRYEDALAQLRDLAAGRISLPPAANGAPAAQAFDFDGYSAPRVFDDVGLKDF